MFEIRSYRTAFSVGVASAVAMVLAMLALTDIAHDEGDLTLEWRALQFAFVVMGAFHVLGLAAIRKAIRTQQRD